MANPIVRQQIFLIKKKSDDPKVIRNILLNIHRKKDVPNCNLIARMLKRGQKKNVPKRKHLNMH